MSIFFSGGIKTDLEMVTLGESHNKAFWSLCCDISKSLDLAFIQNFLRNSHAFPIKYELQTCRHQWIILLSSKLKVEWWETTQIPRHYIYRQKGDRGMNEPVQKEKVLYQA